MSLKAFHVLFIAVSILLAFGFAAWSWRQYVELESMGYLAVALLSAVCGVGLIAYGRYFLRKLKHISYL